MSKDPWEADLTPAVRRVGGGSGERDGSRDGSEDLTPAVRRIEEREETRAPDGAAGGSDELIPAVRRIDDEADEEGLIPAVRRIDDGAGEADSDDLIPAVRRVAGVREADAEAEEGSSSGTGFATPHPSKSPNLKPAVTRVRGREKRLAAGETLPADVRKYDRFKKVDGATYDRVNDFLRDRTYITAREWAIARLCADFRTETGVEMTKIGENLPYLVPFMTDTYTPQAVNQARSAFRDKVRKAGATFLYGAMCDFFTADELDDVMYEVTEVAKFLLEVEGVDLAVEDELDAEERISSVMREVRQASDSLRHEGVSCPECGHEFDAKVEEHADHASADD